MQELLYTGQQDYWNAAGRDVDYIAGTGGSCSGGGNFYTQQLDTYNASLHRGGGRGKTKKMKGKRRGSTQKKKGKNGKSKNVKKKDKKAKTNKRIRKERK